MFTHTHSHTRALTHRASVPSQLAPQAPEGWVYSHCDEEVSARPLVGQGQGLACPPSSLVHQRHRRPGTQSRGHGQTWCGALLCSLSSRFCQVSSLLAYLLFDVFHKKLLFIHDPYFHCSQLGDWPEDLACVPRDRADPCFWRREKCLAAGLAVVSASARGRDHTALCWGRAWGSWPREFGGRGEKSYGTFFLPEESRPLVFRETGNDGQWLVALFLRRLGRKTREWGAARWALRRGTRLVLLTGLREETHEGCWRKVLGVGGWDSPGLMFSEEQGRSRGEGWFRSRPYEGRERASGIWRNWSG